MCVLYPRNWYFYLFLSLISKIVEMLYNLPVVFILNNKTDFFELSTEELLMLMTCFYITGF